MEAARPAEGTKAPTSSASSSISLDAMRDALAYLAAFVLVAWGVIHVAPTRRSSPRWNPLPTTAGWSSHPGMDRRGSPHVGSRHSVLATVVALLLGASFA
jgi:hypothetical protein